MAFALSAVAQQIDWPKINAEAMRNYQSLVQIDSTTSEAGVAAFVKKTLEAEGIDVTIAAKGCRASKRDRPNQGQWIEEAAADHGPQRYRQG